MSITLDDITGMSGKRRDFLEFAIDCVGLPSTAFLGRNYPVGPSGDMSCSGFICWIADEKGIIRPMSKFTERPVRTSREIFFYWGKPVSYEEADAGDLVFFSAGGVKVSHIGIYIGNDLYIASPGTKGKRIVFAEVDEFEPHYFPEGRRGKFDIVFEQNPVGFNRIF